VSSGGDPAIEVNDLTKRYRRGSAPALDAVSLSIPVGSFTALVGPNGAGKTTLINCCLGFEKPTAGTLRVMGVNPAVDRAGVLRRVGYVGQHPGLYRELSASDHLQLAATMRADFDRLRAISHLEFAKVPIEERTDRLSGGQQAQIALALALGTRAPLLLLDEPLASLDPLARRNFLTAVLETVRADGTTVVLSSHIVGELEGLCDRLIVLAPARVVLHEKTDSARGSHMVLPASGAVPARSVVIGTFTDERGTGCVLVRAGEPVSTPASLNDLVLGYLAAANDPVAAA
jgi:ABC-2 type transport system ATP-binding protein